MSFLANGELVVVETDDDWYLGTVEIADGTLIVRSGFVGRPVVLALEDVQRMVPAHELTDLDGDGPDDSQH